MDTTTTTEYPVATRWEMITGETPPADLSRIPAEQAEALVKIFAPYAQQIQTLTPDAWDLTVTDEDDHAGMQRAQRLRKALREIRLEAEKLRKQHKEYSLVTGRVVDWFGKQVTVPAERAEAHLEAQEKYREIQEFNRRSALGNARLEILRPIADDLGAFGDLATMSDEAFERLRAMLQAAHDKAETEAAERRRLEAEQRAEALRLREENDRLRLEIASRAQSATVPAHIQSPPDHHERNDKPLADLVGEMHILDPGPWDFDQYRGDGPYDSFVEREVRKRIEARGWLWLISNLKPSNEARAIVGPGDTMDDGFERIASTPVTALITAYVAALEATL